MAGFLHAVLQATGFLALNVDASEHGACPVPLDAGGEQGGGGVWSPLFCLLKKNKETT